jgi:hypothetical protein
MLEKIKVFCESMLSDQKMHELDDKNRILDHKKKVRELRKLNFKPEDKCGDDELSRLFIKQLCLNADPLIYAKYT